MHAPEGVKWLGRGSPLDQNEKFETSTAPVGFFVSKIWLFEVACLVRSNSTKSYLGSVCLDYPQLDWQNWTTPIWTLVIWIGRTFGLLVHLDFAIEMLQHPIAMLQYWSHDVVATIHHFGIIQANMIRAMWWGFDN